MTTAPGDRPTPPVRRLREAGVAVGAGSDGVRDAWTPFGNADMLERAMLIAYRNGFRTDALVHGRSTSSRGATRRCSASSATASRSATAPTSSCSPGETLGELVAMRPTPAPG